MGKVADRVPYCVVTCIVASAFFELMRNLSAIVCAWDWLWRSVETNVRRSGKGLGSRVISLEFTLIYLIRRSWRVDKDGDISWRIASSEEGSKYSYILT